MNSMATKAAARGRGATGEGKARLEDLTTRQSIKANIFL